MFICSVCGNKWTKGEYDSEVINNFAHGLDDLVVDLPSGWCPSCGEDGDVNEVDDREAAYQQAIKREIKAEMKVAKAYPALFDDSLYAEQMKDAGRGRLLRGGS